MRGLTLSLLALAFAVGTMTVAHACPGMQKTAQGPTTVAEAETPAPSTKIQVPGS